MEISKKDLKHQDLESIPKQNPQNQPTQLTIKSPIEDKDDKMKHTLLVIVAAAMLFGCSRHEENHQLREHGILRVHEGLYAFCGASGAVPTGGTIIVQGVEFEEGCAICPVLRGPSISNLAMYGEGGTWGEFNVKGNFQTPDSTRNTVWSLYWYFDTTTTVPQFNPATQDWELMTPNNRAFIVNTDSARTSESNMFAMPGIIFDTTETGIILAKCYGPLNEAAIPLRKAIPVTSGMKSITAAKDNAPYPVGTPIPVMNVSKTLKAKRQ